MKWKNISVKVRTSVLLQGINLEIEKGDFLGITGFNGSGKTVLARAIAGELPVYGDVLEVYDFAKKHFVPFHSSLSLANGQAVYRQQRWNKIDTGLLPIVKNELLKTENSDLAQKLLFDFGMGNLEDSFVINLSNGEQRKLELIRALAAEPDLLVLDNAFTGLDSFARPLFSEMLETLVAKGQTIVMTGLEINDFPPSVNRFLIVNEGKFIGEINDRKNIPKATFIHKQSFELPEWTNSAFSELVFLNGVTLDYGGRKILNNINWLVNAGEKWALSGPNGSGKTSLLNLIFGDNPKAYGCNIRLFGKKKGSGESIWDIKLRIGFISPELHQYMPQKLPVTDVICSGFNEAEGSFKKPSGYQRDLAHRWLVALSYENIEHKMFCELSTSAQRIVLLLRTLVKNPAMLILDEPFQGLDAAHIRLLKDLLNLIADQTDCAMIFVTHIPEEIPECFTFHLKLLNGSVV